MSRIQSEFERLKKRGEGGLITFLTAGYPNFDSSLELLEAYVRGGADFLEIGVPFSDPLADGPTIQEASQVALANGASVASSLKLVKELRAKQIQVPIILMGYCNPFLAYGIDALARDAALAGADGFIIPDLPPNESKEWVDSFQKQGLDTIFFVAPTTAASRMKAVATHGSGFIYGITLTGVTGAREHLPSDFGAAVTKAKSVSTLPIAMGFGIATPEHVRQVIEIADAAIVASALISKIKNTQESQRVKVIESTVRALKSATRKGTS